MPGARDQAVIPTLLDPLIDAPDNLGKELAVEVGQQHPDRVGPAGDETPGTGVRTVVQPLRRGPHRGTGAGGDQAALVQRPGCGGDGNPRRASNVPDGHQSVPSAAGNVYSTAVNVSIL